MEEKDREFIDNLKIKLEDDSFDLTIKETRKLLEENQKELKQILTIINE